MSLKTRVQTLLGDTQRMCLACEEGEELAAEIKEMRSRLGEPLRVAVVGIMKAGKSTFMNALLKEKILFTGDVETTYTVTWFKYGAKPSIKVVFEDGESQEAPFEHLEKWTVRSKISENPRINEVKYIQIRYPNEVLKTMELIDTPGLQSTHKKDSQNTLDFMGVKKQEELEEAERITMSEACHADAIIYAFTRGAQESDAVILEAFQGNSTPADTSPINALGVFTKADMLWEYDDENPLGIAKQVTQNIIQNPTIKNLLYTIAPVCAKNVENVLAFGEKEWEILVKLSKVDSETLLEILSFYPSFLDEEASELSDAIEVQEALGSSENRKYIGGLLGQYGIYRVTRALREGLKTEEIIDYLYEASGIKDIEQIILKHFGNRSFVIKVKYIFTRLLDRCTQLMNQTNNDQLYAICEQVKDEIDSIQSTEQVFRELKLLQNYYNGVLKIKKEEELEQMLQITGENGYQCEARLGVPNDTPIKELARVANERIKYWNARANDIPITRYYEEAAQVLARSCDMMYYHLQSLTGCEN